LFIEFDEYELMELFCSEPISVHEKDAGIFIYQKQDKFGFDLVMNISVYERTCGISLNYVKYSAPIFDYTLKNVTSIKCYSQKMAIIYGNNETLNVYFEPNFGIS